MDNGAPDGCEPATRSIQEACVMKNIASFIVIALLMGTVAIAVGELFFR